MSFPVGRALLWLISYSELRPYHTLKHCLPKPWCVCADLMADPPRHEELY
jgi:hypothetical protein